MKNFISLELRLKGLLADLDGELWRRLMTELDPPKKIPAEQEVLDMAYRDAKALAGYVPDLMALMQKIRPQEMDERNRQAFEGLLSFMQLATRLLLLIQIIPRYHDHADLIQTLNGFRQTLEYMQGYRALADDEGAPR